MNVADIYCGAGGLSAGFARASLRPVDGRREGYRIVYGVDRDPDAISTFRQNHFRRRAESKAERAAPCRTVVGLTGEAILRAAGVESISVVIGGPNCQGVSAAGLRNPDDERNQMFREFHRLVSELQPAWFVMENVPGLAHVHNRELLIAILELFEEIGYAAAADVLLAADFGVPQLRYRLFIVGNRTGAPIRFPRPEFRPAGAPTELFGPSMPEYKTVHQAIGDLESRPPRTTRNGGSNATAGAKEIANHVAWDTTPENVARIRCVKPGEDWRAIPIELLPERKFASRASDLVGAYGRLSWQGQAQTITGLAPNVTAGMFTHPTQDRPISAREAARLQGFDDDYVFSGRVQSVYRQIGNAVPPPLARAVGRSVLGCHFEPARAQEWGNPGRITLDTLRAWGDKRFAALTHHHVKRRGRRPAGLVRVAPPPRKQVPPSEFTAEPESRVPGDPAQLAKLRLEAELPKNLRSAKRARAIVDYFDGRPLEEISHRASVSQRTIEKWINDFYHGGADGWRAYHTPLERLASGDRALLSRLEAAVARVRSREDFDERNQQELFRPYMNDYLRRLIRRFSGMSVWRLIDTAEKSMGTTVGTIYVGDLLAICDVLLTDDERTRTACDSFACAAD
jgi:DNA (cytosine-5)-methyltransferase 1